MGIGPQIKEFEQEVLNLLGLKYKGLKWCKLGNQRTQNNEVAKIYIYLPE